MTGFKHTIEPAGMAYADMDTTSGHPTWYKWSPQVGAYIVAQSGPHKQAIRELFEDLLTEYESAASAVEREWGNCDIEKNVTPGIEKYRNHLNALLSADDWHKWPSEWPSKKGVYIVMQSEDEDIKPSMFTAHFCEEAGWWEDIEGNSYLDVTHWRELPEPPKEGT